MPGQAEQPLECSADAHVALLREPLTFEQPAACAEGGGASLSICATSENFSHAGARCSFDAFLKKFHLKDPALDELALIVRGADTNRLDLAPQAPGLAAISLGLSRLFENDLEMLEHGMVMYDALYAWF